LANEWPQYQAYAGQKAAQQTQGEQKQKPQQIHDAFPVFIQ
jgi:hypothetical protein